jgi:hypothetical protein
MRRIKKSATYSIQFIGVSNPLECIIVFNVIEEFEIEIA